MWKEKEKKNIKWYVILHVIFFIYAVSSVFGKKAGEYTFLSCGFLKMYAGVIACLLLYALVWQQVIKHIPLITAYASRAVTIVWGVFFGKIFYKEEITFHKVFSLLLIIMGIILFARADHEPMEEEND